MPPVWKQPLLIGFDSFEDVLARYVRRASAEELRGLHELETLRRTRFQQAASPTDHAGISQATGVDRDINQPRAWRGNRPCP